MTTPKRRAVISVYDKTDLVPFLKGLAEDDWGLFATEGTQKVYSEATAQEISSLHELVKLEGLVFSEGREMTAQLVSGLMICRQAVQLACVNLRPPRLEGEPSKISLDVGGMALISAAGNSGALVVTRPPNYQQVLEQLNYPAGVSGEFQQQLQLSANAHIIDHLAEATRLIN